MSIELLPCIQAKKMARNAFSRDILDSNHEMVKCSPLLPWVVVSRMALPALAVDDGMEKVAEAPVLFTSETRTMYAP